MRFSPKRSIEPYGCRLTRSAAQNIANNAETAVSYDTESSDPYGLHDGVNPTRITVNRTGRWLFTALERFTAAAGGLRRISLRVGGVSYIGTVITLGVGAGSATFVNVAAVAQLSAGQYVEVTVLQDTGAALDLQADTENVHFAASYLGN